jgi:hypothetical protein
VDYSEADCPQAPDRRHPPYGPWREVPRHQYRSGRSIDFAENHRDLRLSDFLAQSVAKADTERRFLPVLRQVQVIRKVERIWGQDARAPLLHSERKGDAPIGAPGLPRVLSGVQAGLQIGGYLRSIWKKAWS